MPLFDIPIIASINAETIEEARQQVYGLVEYHNNHQHDYPHVELNMGDDSYKASGNRRAVILHPEDADSEYSPEEYEKSHKVEEE